MNVPKDLTNALGPADMALNAIRAAIVDVGVDGIESEIDQLTSIRIFSDSGPVFPSPFGRSTNLPASIAKRARLSPKRIIYSKLGGEQPQVQLAETAKALQAGDAQMAIVCGGEAIANMKSAKRNWQILDWSDEPFVSEACISIDHGFEFSDLPLAAEEMRQQLVNPISLYALIETAHRLKLNMSVSEYQEKIGQAFEPFAIKASKNPFAMFKSNASAKDIASPSAANPMLASPYTKAMVAKDGVNQGAAVIMTTVMHAKRLGVARDKWIFLNGFAKGDEPNASERPEIDDLPVLEQVIESALSGAGVQQDQIKHTDFYSCFPIVVFKSVPLLKEAQVKQHTLTGGLPFFGGPGNNYSLHAIAEMVKCLRGTQDYGLIHANGGIMTKHAVGVYSANPSGFSETPVDYKPKKVEIEPRPEGKGKLVSYCLKYQKNIPVDAMVLALMPDGKHALAKFEGSFERLEQVKRHQAVSLEAGKIYNTAKLE